MPQSLYLRPRFQGDSLPLAASPEKAEAEEGRKRAEKEIFHSPKRRLFFSPSPELYVRRHSSCFSVPVYRSPPPLPTEAEELEGGGSHPSRTEYKSSFYFSLSPLFSLFFFSPFFSFHDPSILVLFFLLCERPSPSPHYFCQILNRYFLSGVSAE